MGLANVQHSCPIADGMWQLAVSPELLLTKCSMSVQNLADGNWLGLKSRGSSGYISWGMWAKYATLIHTGSKGLAEELSSPVGPKWAWFQWILGFAVHQKFERTASLKTYNLVADLEWVGYFLVKKTGKPATWSMLHLKQILWAKQLLSNKLKRK